MRSNVVICALPPRGSGFIWAQRGCREAQTSRISTALMEADVDLPFQWVCKAATVISADGRFLPSQPSLNRNSVQVWNHGRNSDHLILSTSSPSGDGFFFWRKCWSAFALSFWLDFIAFISGFDHLSVAKRSFEMKYSTVGGQEWDSCLDLRPIPLQIQRMCRAGSLAGALVCALWGSGAIVWRPHTHWVNPDWGGRFRFPPTVHRSVAFQELNGYPPRRHLQVKGHYFVHMMPMYINKAS